MDVLPAVTFAGDNYVITPNGATFTAAYTELAGNSYANFSGDISSIIADNNALTFKVKNNGAATAKVRVDIQCTDGSGTNDSNFCNKSAVVAGATEQGNDYEYGGADWLKIAAGETATVTVEFTTGVGAHSIMFFADSSTYDDETTHTGSLVFSDMKLFTLA